MTALDPIRRMAEASGLIAREDPPIDSVSPETDDLLERVLADSAPSERIYHGDPFGRVEEITPKRAQELLDTMAPNRPPKPAVVAKISAKILKGDYILTHQGMAIDWYGRLVDGQHRCLAVIATGESIQVWMMYGLDPASFTEMDQETKRTNGDTLALVGYKHYRHLPGLIQVIRLFDEKPLGSWDNRVAVRMDGQEVLRWAAELRDPDAHINFGRTFRNAIGKVGHEPVFAGASYIIERDSGLSFEELKDEFWGSMMTGANMYVGDPRLAYLRWLRGGSYKGKKGGTMGSREHMGATIKTFNDWIVKKTRQNMVMRDDEVMPRVTTASEAGYYGKAAQ